MQLEGIGNIVERMKEIQEKMNSFQNMGAPKSNKTEDVTANVPVGDFKKELEKNLAVEKSDWNLPVSANPATGPYADAVTKAASTFGIPAELIQSVMERESNNNPKAVSPKGAMGLMQLMPDTANEMAVSDPFNPEENIMGGTKYLSGMLSKFDGNLVKALAAYNAGPHALKDGKVPNYPETQDYVRKVMESYLKKSGLASTINHEV
jgi:soluble lytic murein transglycosylase-like protein